MKTKRNIAENAFCDAQRKAFRIWHEMMINVPKDDIWNILHNGVHIAISEMYNVEPSGLLVPYVVHRGFGSGINMITGMFRFEDEYAANEFIHKMGKQIYYLFPYFDADLQEDNRVNININGSDKKLTFDELTGELIQKQ